MPADRVTSSFTALARLLESTITDRDRIASLAHRYAATLRGGGTLFFAGNGGSAADAQHCAAEYVVRYVKNRKALPALALGTDPAFATAAGNDYGFDEIFARQVAAFGLPGDLLICLTTSGKSKNVLRALEEARSRKLKAIAFLGRDGGSTIDIADVDLLVRSDSTARIQEAHELLLHVLCETVESRLNQM